MGRESCAAADTAIVCDPELAAPGEERAGLDRIVEVSEGGDYRVVTRVRPRPGSALDRYLAAPPNAVAVAASSQLASDPAVRAQAAADQNRRTTWVASPLDSAPTLTVTLPAQQQVNGVLLQTAPDAPASRPLEVTVEVNGLALQLFTDAQGFLAIPPVTTDELSLRFGAVNPVRSIDSGTGASVQLPVGVTELVVRGGRDRRMLQPESAAVPVPCGFGPEVRVDDRDPVLTRVDATVGGILEGALAPGASCGETITLAPGVHRIRVEPTEEWTVERVFLLPVRPAPPSAAPGTARVVSWGATEREVDVPSADGPRLLELTENFNDGWRATLAGENLAAYRVDGWRQAFLVPPGAAGQVRLWYAPDIPYRGGLLVGLVAVLALLALAIPRGGRGADLPPVGPAGLVRTSVACPIVVALLVGSGPGLAAALVVPAASWVVGRRRPGAALVTARALGLLGAGTGLAAQVVLPWPASAEAGTTYQVLLIVGPALALGALATVAASHRRRAPKAGSGAPGGAS
jgi:arabinofuranan 3-O-arabinosyltransferase